MRLAVRSGRGRTTNLTSTGFPGAGRGQRMRETMPVS